MSRKKTRKIRLIRVSPLQAKMLGIPPNSTEVRKEEKDMNVPIPLKNRATGSYGDNVNAGAGDVFMRQNERQLAANPAPVEAPAEAATEEAGQHQKTRLAKPHREALNTFLLSFPTLVGIHPKELADRFNAAYPNEWPVPVTRWHVLGLAQLMGYRTLNYKLVRYAFPQGSKAEIIEPLPVEPRLIEPLSTVEPTAVTMYLAADGSVHATKAEAVAAGQAEDFGDFIYQNCQLQLFDAKQLAVSILKHYTVSKKV